MKNFYVFLTLSLVILFSGCKDYPSLKGEIALIDSSPIVLTTLDGYQSELSQGPAEVILGDSELILKASNGIGFKFLIPTSPSSFADLNNRTFKETMQKYALVFTEVDQEISRQENTEFEETCIAGYSTTLIPIPVGKITVMSPVQTPIYGSMRFSGTTLVKQLQHIIYFMAPDEIEPQGYFMMKEPQRVVNEKSKQISNCR